MKHTLAVVLYADVVGYSRLIGVNEQATLEILSNTLERFTKAIENNDGIKIKEAGDAILAEFQSAVSAIDTAVEFQKFMLNYNGDLPASERFEYRIGINLGEIVHDRNDIFGDGVNLAARIQDFAKPGGISIAASVYELVKSKVDLQFHDEGFQNFKNIKAPVQVYSLDPEDLNSSKNTEHPATFFNKRVKSQPLFDFQAGGDRTSPSATGGCICGKIRFTVSEPEIGAGFCHCRICQRALGAAVNSWVAFPLRAVKFTDGKPAVFKSSKIAERGFCSNCGTSLTYQILKPEPSEFIVICIPAFDEPKQFSPVWHGGIESQLPWLKIQDDLPRIRSPESPALQKAWSSVGYSDPEFWIPETQR